MCAEKTELQPLILPERSQIAVTDRGFEIINEGDIVVRAKVAVGSLRSLNGDIHLLPPPGEKQVISSVEAPNGTVRIVGDDFEIMEIRAKHIICEMRSMINKVIRADEDLILNRGRLQSQSITTRSLHFEGTEFQVQHVSAQEELEIVAEQLHSQVMTGNNVKFQMRGNVKIAKLTAHTMVYINAKQIDIDYLSANRTRVHPQTQGVIVCLDGPAPLEPNSIVGMLSPSTLIDKIPSLTGLLRESQLAQPELLPPPSPSMPLVAPTITSTITSTVNPTANPAVNSAVTPTIVPAASAPPITPAPTPEPIQVVDETPVPSLASSPAPPISPSLPSSPPIPPAPQPLSNEVTEEIPIQTTVVIPRSTGVVGYEDLELKPPEFYLTSAEIPSPYRKVVEQHSVVTIKEDAQEVSSSDETTQKHLATAEPASAHTASQPESVSDIASNVAASSTEEPVAESTEVSKATIPAASVADSTDQATNRATDQSINWSAAELAAKIVEPTVSASIAESAVAELITQESVFPSLPVTAPVVTGPFEVIKPLPELKLVSTTASTPAVPSAEPVVEKAAEKMAEPAAAVQPETPVFEPDLSPTGPIFDPTAPGLSGPLEIPSNLRSNSGPFFELPPSETGPLSEVDEANEPLFVPPTPATTASSAKEEPVQTKSDKEEAAKPDLIFENYLANAAFNPRRSGAAPEEEATKEAEPAKELAPVKDVVSDSFGVPIKEFELTAQEETAAEPAIHGDTGNLFDPVSEIEITPVEPVKEPISVFEQTTTTIFGEAPVAEESEKSSAEEQAATHQSEPLNKDAVMIHLSGSSPLEIPPLTDEHHIAPQDPLANSEQNPLQLTSDGAFDLGLEDNR